MKNYVRCVAVFAVLAFMAAGQIFADDAMVVSLTGKVEVQRDGAWKALSVGDKVSPGDTVSTGFKSEATFKYETENHTSSIVLGALTRISFDELLSGADNDNVLLSMKSGSVRTTADRASDKKLNFTVKSPVATASVRGTEFTVASDGYITCDRGAVFSAPSSYSGDGTANVRGGTVVSQGQQAVIASHGIESNAYDSVASSVNAVASAVQTVSESSGEGTSVSGMDAMGGRAASSDVANGNAGATGTVILAITFD